MVRVCSWRVRILFRANKPLLLASVVLNVFINGRFCEGGRAWRGEGGISPPYPFSHLTEENCLKEREGGMGSFKMRKGVVCVRIFVVVVEYCKGKSMY